jgi:RteC protein
MLSDFNSIFFELQKQLKLIEKENKNKVSLAENSINTCIIFIEKIKQLIVLSPFQKQTEEILFFKEIKPVFVCQLIYFTKMYHIELNMPTGSDDAKKNYLALELNKLELFFNNNLEFIKYIRTNNTYLDHKYFVRGAYDIGLAYDCFDYEKDREFSTSHDYKVSKIKANELLEVYIKEQIANFNRVLTPNPVADTPKSNLNWMATKTDLTELIYSLQTSNAFGINADVKDIAKCLETAFNVDLGDYYRIYTQMRIRKNGRTKFIDTLKDQLIERMDEEEGN